MRTQQTKKKKSDVVFQTESSSPACRTSMVGNTEGIIAHGHFQLFSAAKGRGGDRYKGKLRITGPGLRAAPAADIYLPQSISRDDKTAVPLQKVSISILDASRSSDILMNCVRLRLEKRAKWAGGDRYEGSSPYIKQEKMVVYLPQGISRASDSKSCESFLLKVQDLFSSCCGNANVNPPVTSVSASSIGAAAGRREQSIFSTCSSGDEGDEIIKPRAVHRLNRTSQCTVSNRLGKGRTVITSDEDDEKEDEDQGHPSITSTTSCNSTKRKRSRVIDSDSDGTFCDGRLPSAVRRAALHGPTRTAQRRGVGVSAGRRRRVVLDDESSDEGHEGDFASDLSVLNRRASMISSRKAYDNLRRSDNYTTDHRHPNNGSSDKEGAGVGGRRNDANNNNKRRRSCVVYSDVEEKDDSPDEVANEHRGRELTILSSSDTILLNTDHVLVRNHRRGASDPARHNLHLAGGGEEEMMIDLTQSDHEDNHLAPAGGVNTKIIKSPAFTATSSDTDNTKGMPNRSQDPARVATSTALSSNWGSYHDGRLSDDVPLTKEEEQDHAKYLHLII